MKKILSKELVTAALRFRAVKPWELLDDSMIYAVQLPSDEIGYCCVMGNGGEHFALGLYRGNDGFNTYLTTISQHGIQSQLESFEMFLTFDCMNCDFVNANDRDLVKEQKDFVRKVAIEEGLKICRPNGWPCFIRMNHGETFSGFEEEADATDMAAALNAGVAIINEIDKGRFEEIGFNKENGYVPLSGGYEIPLVILQADGKYEIGLTKTPGMTPPSYPEIICDDTEIIDKLKDTKHIGVYQCRLIHLPSAIGNKGHSYYPQMLILVREIDQFLLPIFSTTETPHNDEELLIGLGQQLSAIDVAPAEIKVEDPHTEAILKDFCQKTDIKLTTHDTLPLLNSVWEYLHHTLP